MWVIVDLGDEREVYVGYEGVEEEAAPTGRWCRADIKLKSLTSGVRRSRMFFFFLL